MTRARRWGEPWPAPTPSRGAASADSLTALGGSLGQLRIGTSGYVYRHWRKDVFYPSGLPQREELRWYATQFSTVELNTTFYRLPDASSVVRWREAVPPGFLFSVKASRLITHSRRLQHSEAALAQLLERAALLGDRLGPILFQLPPDFPADPPLFEEFLDRLDRGHRWVVEFRHPSWHRSQVYDALGRRAVALCLPVGGRVTPDLVITAPFVYLRFHSGAGESGGFLPEQLESWSARLRTALRVGFDAYAYFNNDRQGHAVRDAVLLASLLDAPS